MAEKVFAGAALYEEADYYKSQLLCRLGGKKAYAALNTRDVLRGLSNAGLVQGVGFGARDSSEDGTGGELAIRVYVRKKLPDKQLTDSQRIPSEIDGMPTDVIQLGVVRSLARPARGGGSIGHYQLDGAGTLGCVVRHSATGELFILSNNHVIANTNSCSIGDDVLEPRVSDGGQHPIARLFDFETLKFGPGDDNVMDAAIARVLDPAEIEPGVIHIGSISASPALPAVNQQVCKYGRTTGYTSGVVCDISADYTDIEYPLGQMASFTKQIAIAGDSAMFSQSGDSGSLILASESRTPVALLFAGDDQKGLTFATPIDLILSRFQVEIHGV
ncbi:MAG: hypothetical protein SF339_20490 [Blastocatellia bacterium]|nr:hypothetical protein [Blastocatellia bacterium]